MNGGYHLELFPMQLRWAVYEAGGHQGYVYFPTTSIVSMMYVIENGASAEIAITGNGGLVGIALFMGGESMSNRAVVADCQHVGTGENIAERFGQFGFLRYPRQAMSQPFSQRFEH